MFTLLECIYTNGVQIVLKTEEKMLLYSSELEQLKVKQVDQIAVYLSTTLSK